MLLGARIYCDLSPRMISQDQVRLEIPYDGDRYHSLLLSAGAELSNHGGECLLSVGFRGGR
jgi:hypothetical protein